MATSRRTPLFNRRYLWILVWLLPVAILVLNRGGSSDGDSSPIQIQRTDQSRLYQLETDDGLYSLNLLLPLPGVLTTPAWIYSDAMSQAVLNRLNAHDLVDWLNQHGWKVTFNKAQDYLLVNIASNTYPDTETRQELIALLHTPPDLDWTELDKRSRAKRYIDLQSNPETRLQNAFANEIQRLPQEPSVSATGYQQLFQLPLVWTLTGPNMPDLESGPQTELMTPETAFTTSSRNLALPPERGEVRVLIGERLPLANTPTRLAHQYLEAALAQHLLRKERPDGSQVHWIWHSGTTQGYQMVVATDWPQTQLQEVLTTLPQVLTEEEFQTIREAALEHFRHIEANTPQQWLDMMAIHAMSADTPKQVLTELRSITLQQAKDDLGKIMQPSRQISIRINH